jgi:hypothetical protein
MLFNLHIPEALDVFLLAVTVTYVTERIAIYLRHTESEQREREREQLEWGFGRSAMGDCGQERNLPVDAGFVVGLR